MNLEEARYILRYFNSYFKKHELYRLQRIKNANDCIDFIKEYNITKEEEKIKIIHFFGISRQDIEDVKINYQTELLRIADQVVKEYASQIVFNKCTICGTLARTPQAKQTKCGHRW